MGTLRRDAVPLLDGIFVATPEGTIFNGGESLRNLRIEIEPSTVTLSRSSEEGSRKGKKVCGACYAIAIIFGVICFAIRFSNRKDYGPHQSNSFENKVTSYKPPINYPTELPSNREAAASKILNGMNPAANPCEDFYEYSCGNWGKVNPKPIGSDMLTWNNFARIDQDSKEILHGILMKPNIYDDPNVKSAKSKYQDCVGDGPKSLRSLMTKANSSSSTPLSMNVVIRKFFPNEERGGVNYTELVDKVLRTLETTPMPDASLTGYVRSACILIVQMVKGNRLIDRMYLKNTLLDDVKVGQTSTIMNNIQNAFIAFLENSQIPWTKTEQESWPHQATLIQQSLRKVKTCIGYFKALMDEDQFPVTLTDLSFLVRIMEEAKSLNSSSDQATLSTSKDSSPMCFWTASPFEPKAQFNVLGRSIEVTYSLIKAPFYDSSRPSALNYGSIGVIMGHEVAHAIEISQYQKKYELAPATKCLIDQYSRFSETILKATVINNVTIAKGRISLNGSDTLEENFADNLGISAAFAAFKKLPRSSSSAFVGNDLPGLENFTDEQLFFLGFSQTWCSDTPPEVVAYQIRKDSHSPERFRVLGSLRNSREFSSAWKCPIGSGMNPIDKCILI